MLKIFSYLKKYTWIILVIILLLFAQAWADLELPSYTSKIVNIGIQQNGVDSPVPDFISESTLDKIILVTNNQSIRNSYKSMSKTTSNKKEYPILERENLYYFDGDKKELEETFTDAFFLIMALSTESDQILTIKNNLLLYLPSELGYNEDTDIFMILKYIPRDTIESIIDGIQNMNSEMPELIGTQVAINSVSKEYETIGIDISKLQTDYIKTSGLEMLGIALIAMICSLVVGLLGAFLASSLARDLRRMIYRKVLQFSNTEFKKFSTASLITRSTNDVSQMVQVVNFMLRMVIYAPIIAIGGIFKIMSTNTSMTWIIGLAIGLILILMIFMFIAIVPKFKVMQTLIDKLNLISREILNGIPVIRAFSTHKHEENRFDKANINLTKVTKFTSQVMAGMMPLIMFIMNIIMVMIIWYGSKGVDVGSMQVGDMMAFMQYTMQIIMAFIMISMMSIMIPRAGVSMARIDEVIKTPSSIKNPETAVEFDSSKKGLVEFVDVNFRYHDSDTDVLENITFTAKPGETTAIIGSTGSGKSTLIKLIPRLFDVRTGCILVDGVDIRSVNQEDLHAKIGYVPQKGVLFAGTIESNVKYGDEEKITDEIVNEALEIAQAKDFVFAKEEGVKSEIAQGGDNVSGGQKQRLSIARAIAINPDIYIFDDSFSALDFKTDSNLRKALKDKTKDKTVIIVAQRISTIMNAEQIIVLDEGKIVGSGKHADLLNNCIVYKEIASSQLSKEEL